MKILQIAPPWFAVPPTGYGGIERVVGALADGLVVAGHDVTLLASGGSRTRAKLQTVYGEPPSADLGDPMVELPHLLAEYLDDSDWDVIHDHTMIGAALGAVRGGSPVVHTLHGPWTDASRRLYRGLADKVSLVAISHSQANGAPDIPIPDVIHNGVDARAFAGRWPRGTHLAFVGRANPEKGPEIALKVARRTDRRLVMALKINEPDEREYFERVIAPRMEGVDVDLHVDATGPEVAEIMGTATALIAPIQWEEPFGLVLAEAGAAGTPVIAFARGAAPEIIKHGHTGFLIEPGDVDGLCKAVLEVGQISALACRHRIASEFSNARMVARYERLYERVAPIRLPEPSAAVG